MYDVLEIIREERLWPYQVIIVEYLLRRTDENHEALVIIAHGSLLVKKLCYKPEGRGLDTRWGDLFL
jgi:hypothetical protein